MTWINLALWGFLGHLTNVHTEVGQLANKTQQSQAFCGSFAPKVHYVRHCHHYRGEEMQSGVGWRDCGRVSPFRIHEHSGSQDYFLNAGI